MAGSGIYNRPRERSIPARLIVEVSGGEAYRPPDRRIVLPKCPPSLLSRRSALLLPLFLFISSIAHAMDYIPGSGITHSPHDLSMRGGAVTYNAPGEYQESSCIWCHAPGNAYSAAGPGLDPEDGYRPLWNRKVPQIFMVFMNGSNHVGARASIAGGPMGDLSLLCLGCHDGRMAINIFAAALSEENKIGRDGNLSNHHPIGLDYARSRASGKELAPPAEVVAALRRGASEDEIFRNGKLECTSCHSVHNTGNTGEKLLWISDRESRLCCSCHLKCRMPGSGRY